MATPFPGVVGHEAVRSALAQALRAGRLGGALLLTGPEGTGRRTLARELARALVCAGPRDGDLPCGACGPCGRAGRGTSPDIIEVAPDGQSIKIEQTQAFLEELALAPVEGRFRAFIIAPAGLMTEDAQNALLKGLEEPPARALLILVAASEDEVLPTIASRCRLVRLGALAPAEVLEVLARAGLPPDEAAARARWCCGSPGRALSEEAAAVTALASGAVEAFASGRAARDPMGTVDALAELVDQGSPEASVRRARLLELLRALQRALRDALLRRVRAGDLPPLSGAEPDLLDRLAAQDPRPEPLERALSHLARLEEEIDQSVNPTLVLEGLVLDVGGALAPPAHAPAAGGRRVRTA